MVFHGSHQILPKEVRSHVSLFKQNNVCPVSASVHHAVFCAFDFQLS